MTLDVILEQAKVTEDQYMSAVKVTKHGHSVVLQRNPSDAYTNGCNHEILHCGVQMLISNLYLMNTVLLCMYAPT